ncbi:MAG: AtpZ/AtpI family protein [Planctomycetes bacterium]|nr:AtpZ/AtpI family protein [Planctomycetota bacterium]
MASVLIGCGLGYAIDETYDTSPAWTITLFMIFMGIGFYHVIKNS